MLPLKYSRERIDAVLEEIEHLADLDFPYCHSRDGLAVLAEAFQKRRISLRN